VRISDFMSVFIPPRKAKGGRPKNSYRAARRNAARIAYREARKVGNDARSR